VVRFLCRPGARYVTGQAIHANGGAYLGARCMADCRFCSGLADKCASRTPDFDVTF
jgi:hypothetical protein